MFLLWELFWQTTPEGSTQILGGVWWGGKVYALKWNFFFKGGKAGESYWTEAQCGFWVASQESGAHSPCLALWEEGKSSPRSLTEQGNCRQQFVNQPLQGLWNLANPDPSSLGSCAPSCDADQKPECRDILYHVLSSFFFCQRWDEMLKRQNFIFRLRYLLILTYVTVSATALPAN